MNIDDFEFGSIPSSGKRVSASGGTDLRLDEELDHIMNNIYDYDDDEQVLFGTKNNLDIS